MREVQTCAYYPFVQNEESTETEERSWKTCGEEEEEEPELSQSRGAFFLFTFTFMNKNLNHILLAYRLAVGVVLIW